MRRRLKKETHEEIPARPEQQEQLNRSYQSLLFFFYAGSVSFFTLMTMSNESLPEDIYFTNKRNHLNMIFVKHGWAWTSLSILILQPYAIAKLYPTARLKYIARFMIRWLAALAYWFICTRYVFKHEVFDALGTCDNTDILEKHVCHEEDFTWTPFDTSGHCFLLIHASMFLWEEIRLCRRSMKLPFLFNETWSIDYFEYGLVFLVGLIMFLWYWMLIITSIFFHTVMEKFLGSAFAFAYWFFAYSIVFPSFDSMPAA